MTNPFIVAQGDVLVQRIEALPEQRIPVAPENGRLVLAHGEATGHHHSFALSDRVALFREDGAGSGLFLSMTEAPAALEHQEHGTIQIPPGTYRVTRQRTYVAGMARLVAD